MSLLGAHRRHVRWVPVPHFLLGYRTPTFQDTGEEFVVIRGDLHGEIKLHMLHRTAFTDTGLLFSFSINLLVWFVQ